jgi:Zn-dependent protease
MTFRLRSTPLRIAPSVLSGVAVTGIAAGWMILEIRAGEASLVAAALWGLAVGFLFYGSALAHEFGHAVAAHSVGISVREVGLGALGGFCVREDSARTPGALLLIAGAGPFANILLAVAGCMLAGMTSSPVDSTAATALWLFVGGNVIFAGANLIPVLPFDGGKILKALFWAAAGRRRADRVLAWTALAVPALLLGAGGTILRLGDAEIGVVILFLAGYLFAIRSRADDMVKEPPRI